MSAVTESIGRVSRLYADVENSGAAEPLLRV
jgi:hypothetical protein